MIAVDRFDPADLGEIRVQPAQADMLRLGAAGLARMAVDCANGGQCFTVRMAGRPVFCGGAYQKHPQHATLWSIFGGDAGPAMLAITRRTRQFLAMLPHRRVDTIVRADHAEGHRWAAALGLTLEAVLGDMFEDGAGAAIYRKGAAWTR